MKLPNQYSLYTGACNKKIGWVRLQDQPDWPQGPFNISFRSLKKSEQAGDIAHPSWVSRCRMDIPPLKTVSGGISAYRPYKSRGVTLDAELDQQGMKTCSLAIKVVRIRIWRRTLSWYQTPSCICTLTITHGGKRLQAVDWKFAHPYDW